MRTLVPGCTGYDIETTDDKTLMIQSEAPDIFSCDDVAPIHLAYYFRTLNLFLDEPRCEKGDPG